MGNGEMFSSSDPLVVKERADDAVNLVNRFNAIGGLGDGIRISKITSISMSEGIDVLADILGADLLGCADDGAKRDERFFYYFYYGDVTFTQLSKKELGKDTIHVKQGEQGV